MNKLMIFNNPEFGEIRTIEKDGEPWFVGKDVATALGYSDTKSALADHVDDEDKQIIQKGQITTFDIPNRGMTIVNESGLYALVFGSKLADARKFKHWVTSEVLPSIRKTGEYKTPAKAMSDYQKLMMETREQNVRVQKARLLNQIAAGYEGTYRQVLHAHATKELTGEFLLPLPRLEEKTYSATEIGKILGISSQKVGILTNRHNLKTEEFGAWFHDRAKASDKEVQSFRYYESVIPVLRSLADQPA